MRVLPRRGLLSGDVGGINADIPQLALGQTRQPGERPPPVVPALYRREDPGEPTTEAGCSVAFAREFLVFNSGHFASPVFSTRAMSELLNLQARALVVAPLRLARSTIRQIGLYIEIYRPVC